MKGKNNDVYTFNVITFYDVDRSTSHEKYEKKGSSLAITEKLGQF